MHDKWGKRAARAVNHRLSAFDQIQNVNTAVCMVCHRRRKPVAAGFDKLTFVHPGSFFPPSVSFSNGLNAVDQVVVNPLRIALPVNDLLPMIQMDGTRQSVQTKTPPVP